MILSVRREPFGGHVSCQPRRQLFAPRSGGTMNADLTEVTGGRRHGARPTATAATPDARVELPEFLHHHITMRAQEDDEKRARRNSKCKSQNANAVKCSKITVFESCILHFAFRLGTFQQPAGGRSSDSTRSSNAVDFTSAVRRLWRSPRWHRLLPSPARQQRRSDLRLQSFPRLH